MDKDVENAEVQEDDVEDDEIESDGVQDDDADEDEDEDENAEEEVEDDKVEDRDVEKEEEEDVEDDDAEEDRSQDATQLCASLRSRNARQHVTRATPRTCMARSGQAFCKGPRSRAYRKSCLQVYKMGGGEAWFDSPGKTGEPKRNQNTINAFQNACPKFMSRPQAHSFYKFLSYIKSLA